MSVNFDKSRKEWVVRWYEKNPVTGESKQRQKRGFETKREALRFEDQMKDTHTFLSFVQLADLYLDSLKGYANEETIESKRSMIYKYCDSFLNAPVSQIKPVSLQKWKNEVYLLPYSVSHKNRVLQCVKSVSKYGSTYYDYPDFAKTLKAFPKSSDDVKELRVITPEDFAKLIDNCDKELYKRFYIFLYHTGMRRGEAKALLKGDIKGKQCTVSKSIRREQSLVRTLKNAQSRRTITLDAVALHVIEPLMDLEGDYLFGGLAPLPNTSIQRYFDEALKKADLPHYRIHDLRHSFITNAIVNGADIVTVSRYVGHADIQQTLNTYSHLMTGAEERLLAITSALGEDLGKI